MNLHASAVLLRGRGVLIAGPSGSGKTRLALLLVREGLRDGHPASLVCDDQVLLSPGDGGRLVATAPDALFGLVEIRGFGPAPVRAERRCAVDLLVRLVPGPRAPRMAENQSEAIAGCLLPRLDLAERDAFGAMLAVNAFLFGADW